MSLTELDFQRAATKLGCSIAAIKAVAFVESRGDGFLKSGKPKILFERHLFHKITKGKFSARYPKVSNRRPGGYTKDEHARLEIAKSLNSSAALKSASWGQFQILGMNFRACGFSTVEDFVKSIESSYSNHLDAFVNFIIANKVMHNALKSLNWALFAKLYNGPAYKRNNYDVKMRAAHKKFIQSAPLTNSAINESKASADVIKFVQMRLNQLGFKAGKADGILGPNTKGAIMAYQKKNGLPLQFYFDDVLLEKLKNEKVS